MRSFPGKPLETLSQDAWQSTRPRCLEGGPACPPSLAVVATPCRPLATDYSAQEMSRTDGVRLQWFYCLRMMEELDLRASRLVFGELVPPSLSMRSLLGPPHGPMTRSCVVFPEAECWMHTVNFLQLPPLLMAYSYQKTWQSFLIPLISLKPALCSPTSVHQLLLWL